MNINRTPNTMGLQHMAARAQEVRKQLPSETATSTLETGNTETEAGKKLPEINSNIPQKTEHDTGLARAIERLQLNTEKNPEAKGLQQALEKLQARLPTSTTIDTAA